MKTVLSFICLLFTTNCLIAQAVTQKLTDAIKNLEADSQLKSAIVGLCVANRNGEVVFEENAKVGLAVASSQKVITSVAALDLLGPDYRYKTKLAYSGSIENGTLNGNIYIIGYGDPTLGSRRYDKTTEKVILNKWTQSIRQAGIKQINGAIIGFDKNWESQTIPGGWVWDDIGNYYGAGVSALNWHENQYDINLQPGSKEGDTVTVVSVKPILSGIHLINELKTGKPQSGDNAYIYLPPYSTIGFIRGTIPAGKNIFTISGAVPNAAAQPSLVLKDELQQQGIETNSFSNNNNEATLPKVVDLSIINSPALDSINYWFLKKSINLFGETLVKTLGYEKAKQGSTAAGLKIIKDFWQKKELDPASINIIDGSGLSPANRVTPEALVKVMQYAKTAPWFNLFYNALPYINGIKMKSGSMGGVRSFTGYTRNYTFAVVVNNYNGSSAEIVQKIFRLLDLLK